MGTVADFFLSQSYAYIPPLLNTAKVTNLFATTWKPLLYQPWCSLIFNQIYMGSHWLCCQKLLRPWRGVTSLFQNYLIELSYYMTLQNRHNYAALFWAMTSFIKVLKHAKIADNHCWSAVMQYFECMVPKTFYLCFLCLRNQKVSNSFYPGSRKVLTSAKIIISVRKCCRHLMQDSLN